MSADEWANNRWQDWWEPHEEISPEDGDNTMEQPEKRQHEDGLEDSWAEAHAKRHKRLQEAAEKRTRAARSTAGSGVWNEEEHAKRLPKFENAPPGLAELIQELREEKAQLRAENRELKAKLDELIARLASTGVEGDHIEQDVATGQHLTFPRTFAADVTHQLALYRHPWHVTRQQLAHDELDNVSRADNLCYWRCLQGMLAGEGHSDAFLPTAQTTCPGLCHRKR
eukprot:865254-Amphidinium_carterae.1